MCKTLLTNVIPPHLHVLVLANYRDRPTVPSGSVPVSEGRALVQLRADTHFLECSCKDGFGRTQILSFLNVPFLKMQKAHLEALLARNAEDMLVAAEEFELISFEIDYASYLTWVKVKVLVRILIFVVYCLEDSTCWPSCESRACCCCNCIDSAISSCEKSRLSAG
jgi:hypothetical protein